VAEILEGSVAKIVMIGAGSMGFTRKLIIDILNFKALRDSTVALVDIDAGRLDMITRWAKKLIEQEKLPAKIESSTDRREVLKGADFIVITIRVGGLEAFELDVSIPRKYGVKQAVGDTLGPGGVFYAMRTIPVLLGICKDANELCPDALILNYSNPMAMNTWAMLKYGHEKTIGLCHSVQGTAGQLSNYIGVPFGEVSYWVAGINHMSWFLEFRHKDVDAYPKLWKALENPDIFKQDPVRFEIMKHFDYFVTESSFHMAEYMPYFNKREELIKKFNTHGWIYLELCKQRLDPAAEQIRKEVAGEQKIDFSSSPEYCSSIINAATTGISYRMNASVFNRGIISNLPQESCVEVPCYVDKTGVRPAYVGELPLQCAALNRSSINVQALGVEAAVEGSRRKAFQAICLDPLTAAALSLEEIQKMTDEMFEAEAQYLPQFK